MADAVISTPAPRADRIPAARVAVKDWLTRAALRRDIYLLTQARDFACATSCEVVDIVEAIEHLQPWAWLALCSTFGIAYTVASHG
ncbi:MAG TPA: hypothetical protein VIP05_33720 [Burkholderiaceae bacterium]